MSKYIAVLIKEGEHQQLDFKHSISDSKKIARSLVAFANTHGGKLLLGVKDNGNVVGVNSDEEYYMVEAAAQLYCRPKVPFSVVRWEINGKVVLEVIVKPKPRTLHKAPDKNGKYKVFFRLNDQNVLATPLQVKVWNAKHHRRTVNYSLTKHDEILIKHLREKKRISIDEYSKIGFLPHREAERRLIDLVVLGVVEFESNAHCEEFVLITSIED